MIPPGPAAGGEASVNTLRRNAPVRESARQDDLNAILKELGGALRTMGHLVDVIVRFIELNERNAS